MQTKISSNIDSHKQFLGDLVTEFKKIASSSKALTVNEARNQEKMKLFHDWRIQYQRYKGAKDGLRKGRVFYTDLKSSLDDLKSKVIKFVNQRNAERVTLGKKIEAEFAESGQRAIKEQLQKLSVGSPNASGGIASPYQSGAPQNIALSQSSASFSAPVYHVQQPSSYRNDIPQAQIKDFNQPSAPIISPQSSQTFGSQNPDQQGSRTPIPPLRSSRNSFTRDSSSSGGLEVDHSPASVPVTNYPRATFDAQQFHALANRQQPYNNISSSPTSPSIQGGVIPSNTMYTPQVSDQHYAPVQRLNSLPKDSVVPQMHNIHTDQYAGKEYLASAMPIRGQVYRPQEHSRPDQVFSHQNNTGLGQFNRPIQGSQEYIPLHSYVPSQGYMPQQSGYQPPLRAPPPQAYQPPQGYHPPEYRPNVSDIRNASYRPQIRNDMYNSRPGIVPQTHIQGTPSFGNNNPAPSLLNGYSSANHPSNRPNLSGFTGQPSAQEYQSNRPSHPQAYLPYQRPDSASVYAPQSQFSGDPSNQGYGYPANINRPPPGYIQHEGPPVHGYRPPMNVMYAQQDRPPYQRPPGTGYGGQEGARNTQANQYAQYNSSHQNPNNPGQNHGRSLMD